MKRALPFRPSVLLVCALAAVLGLTAGFLLRSRSAGSQTDAAQAQAAVKSAFGPDAASARAGSPLSKTPSPASADRWKTLAERLAVSPRIERWLLLVAAAEKAAPDEFPGLLNLCAGDSAAQQMIAARWADLDPPHLWRAMSAAAVKGVGQSVFGMSFRDLSGVLLDSWLTRDSAAAITAFDQVENLPGIRTMRVSVFDRFLKADPEKGLRLLDRWSTTHYLPNLKPLGEWALKEPRRAAEVMRECGSEYPVLSAGEMIGGAWAKTDPAAALEFAVSTLSGAQRSALARGAVKVWAEKDPRDAAAFVAAQGDSAFRAALAVPLVAAWAKKAPDEALRWAGENLRGEARGRAIGGIVEEVAQRDVTAAAELVTGLDEGGARNTAAGRLALQWFEKAGAAPVIEWLAALPDPEARRAAFNQMQWQWAWKDPEGAVAFVTGPQADLAPPEFAVQVASAQARKDPEAAMQWVEKIPAAARSQAREVVLSEWINSRPEAASAWVLQQPAGAERDGFLTVAARYLVWRSPEAAEGFISGLGPQDRQTVRGALESTGMDEARKAALLKKLAE